LLGAALDCRRAEIFLRRRSAPREGSSLRDKDEVLSKDDLIDMQGTVVAVHSGGLYRVQCDAGHEVLAQLSGRMRRFRIKVVPGDRVTVGVSPYDPVRGIITFRAR
jgi:translation initiation factor IF-1